VAASPFERQVVESDAADERSPSMPKLAEGPQQYPPSPSFLENDRPKVRLVELPAWLQSFASSVGEPSEFDATATPDAISPELAAGPSDHDDQGEAKLQKKSSRPRSSNVGADFISEDDLPEWLRAIAPDESAENSMEVFVLDRGEEEGEQITVPNITRAWSTSKDSRGVDETTSLFALVASQTPHTALPDQGSTSAAQHARARSAAGSADQVATYGSDRPPGGQSSIEMPSPTKQETAADEKQFSIPILPVVVGGIIFLMLLIVAAYFFIL
jgi:hypothetical protein